MKKCNKRVLAFLMAVGLFVTGFAGLGVDAKATATGSEKRTVIEFNASELSEGDITTEMVVGNFVITADNSKRYTVDANSKCSADGTLTFTKRLKSNGASDKMSRTISFYAPGPGTVTVYMLSANSGAANRKMYLTDAYTGTDVPDQKATAPTSAGDGGKLEPFTFEVPAEGGYYLKVDDGINVYYVKGDFEGEGTGAISRTEWKDVAAPVINSVTLNEEGTLDVDVSMVIGTQGADSARLFLFQNGFEVTNVQITDSGVYNVIPIWEGDYTLKVIASRKGFADKESEEVAVTGYKLPLVKPQITWVNNLGGGSVYVDWKNIEAEKFEIAYKGEGDGDYTVAASDLTDAHYTLTGLEDGKKYEIKVTATKEGETSEATAEVVAGAPVQQWYVAAIGSATNGFIDVNGTEYNVVSAAELTPVEDVTANGGKVTIKSAANGKIADSEDGFFYYFTYVDPNTENFKLTATYTVVDVADGPDNQTGYGIYACDIAGIGSKDTKYFNSVSVGQYKLKGGGYHSHGARLTTGYTAPDALNNVGATRNLDSTNIFSVANETDEVKVGDTFTYTLEKTNDGYVASMDGADASITFDGAASIMQQEDGSICVGVMNARKVGVEITDIKFEKSAGTAGGEVVTMTEPSFKVYSSNTTGSTEYEFIASANVAGTLSVKDASGQSVFDGALEADKVVKTPVTLVAGEETTYTYTFTPDNAVENLTSYDAISGEHKVKVVQIGKEGETIYVAPTGATNGKGTMEEPLALQTALSYAQPGQVIVMLDGTYEPTTDLVIGRNVNGTESAPIVLMAQNTGKAVIDGSKIDGSKSILSVVGSYWHIYGIEVMNGAAKGISVCGNNNIIEMCVIHNVGNTGIQISRYAGEPNDSMMWPSNNLIKNCEAYDCCDEGRNDADGFAAKLTCGEGNKFYGCIAHHNVDDGWDLYAKSTTGPIGKVVIENCVAYSNGFLSTDDPATLDEKLFGEGNGFKLGGENIAGGHQLINSIAYNNYGKGITSNSCPDCEVINCTAFNNSLNGKSYNISLYTKNSNPKAWIMTGMLSVVTNSTTSPELGSSNGVIYSLRSVDNYLYDGADCANSKGDTVGVGWFKNVDITVAPERNEDGTINMHGLLEINGLAPKDTGARLVTDGDAVSVQPTAASTIVSAIVGELPKTEATEKPAGEADGEDSGIPVLPITVGAGVVLAIGGAVASKKKGSKEA
ncbi:MAG: hypothetical protein II994_03290 [Lachnospiraceae bacterium]|nr:hypothetical protein [Lachnospiraceae bacterium]